MSVPPAAAFRPGLSLMLLNLARRCICGLCGHDWRLRGECNRVFLRWSRCNQETHALMLDRSAGPVSGGVRPPGLGSLVLQRTRGFNGSRVATPRNPSRRTVPAETVRFRPAATPAVPRSGSEGPQITRERPNHVWRAGAGDAPRPRIGSGANRSRFPWLGRTFEVSQLRAERDPTRPSVENDEPWSLLTLYATCWRVWI